MNETMKLNNENMRLLIDAIKYEITAAEKELSEIDINDLTLDDLIHYKSKIRTTVTNAKSLSILLEMLDILAENYFLSTAAYESFGQILDRVGDDNDISLAISNHTELEITERINTINKIIESDAFKSVTDDINDESISIESKKFLKSINRADITRDYLN